MPTATASRTQRKHNSPGNCQSNPALVARARQLLQTEIDFISNPEFRHDRTGNPEFVAATLEILQSYDDAPPGLPPHLRRMCASDLLAPEEESALFREMNYLKYRANALRSRLVPDQAELANLEQIERLLEQASQIRDQIIQANVRLVMSIVKKFVIPEQSFDELLSDGMFVLMQAVEKFDYSRGIRFSTYAYRCVARHSWRCVSTARREAARRIGDGESWALEQPDESQSSASTDRVWGRLRELTISLLDHLDRRERLIIRSRYALGSHRRVRTFQDLADRLGISKERVRQLEQRALGKLKTLAAQREMHTLYDVATV